MEIPRNVNFVADTKQRLTEIGNGIEGQAVINLLLTWLNDLQVYVENSKKTGHIVDFTAIKTVEQNVIILKNSFNTLIDITPCFETHIETVKPLWLKIALRATDSLHDLQKISLALIQPDNIADSRIRQQLINAISDSLKPLHYNLLIIDNEIDKLKKVVEQTVSHSKEILESPTDLPVILVGNDRFVRSLSELNDINDPEIWKHNYDELIQSLLQRIQYNEHEVVKEIRMFLFQLYALVQAYDHKLNPDQAVTRQQSIYYLSIGYNAIDELTRAAQLHQDLQKASSSITTHLERLKYQHLLNESNKVLNDTMATLRQLFIQISPAKSILEEPLIYYKKLTREQLQSYLNLRQKNDPLTLGSLNDYIKRKYFPQELNNNLYRADLSGVNLAKLNLNQIDLSNTLMVRTKLVGARLKNTDLTNSCLYQANLQKADLTDAKLIYCNLIEADLRGCNLQGAKIFKTLFLGAKGLQTTAEKQMVWVEETPQSISTETAEYTFNQINYGAKNILVCKKLLNVEILGPEDKRRIYPTVAMKYSLSLTDKEMMTINADHPLNSENILQSLMIKEGTPYCNYDDETIAKTFDTAIKCFTRELILITLVEIADNVEQLTKKLLATNTLPSNDAQQVITWRRLACNSYIEAKNLLFLEEWQQIRSIEDKNSVLTDYLKRMHKDINSFEPYLDKVNLIIDLTNIDLKNQDLSMCQFHRVNVTSQQLKYVLGLNTLQGLNDMLLKEAQRLKQEVIETLLANTNKTLNNCQEMLESLIHLNRLVCQGACPNWDDLPDDTFKKLAYLAMTNELFINTLPLTHALAAANIDARGYERFIAQERAAICSQLEAVLRTRNNFQLLDYVIALVQCSKANALFNDADNIGLTLIDAEKVLQDIAPSEQESLQCKIEIIKVARKDFLARQDAIMASYNQAYLKSTLQHLQAAPDFILQDNAHVRLSTLLDLVRGTKQVLDLSTLNLEPKTLASFDLKNVALKLTQEQVKQLLSTSQQQQLDQAFRKAIDTGDIKLVTQYIENGVDINAQDKAGRTSLGAAVVREDENIVKLLLDHGADPSLRTKETAWNIFEYLWRLKDKKSIHFALLDVLKNYYTDEMDLGIVTAFGDLELAEKMLKEDKISPNQSFRGETPLHIAVENGDISMVALLLNHNANPLLKNRADQTPFYLACSRGDVKIVELLWQPEINLNDKQYRDLLQLLAKQVKTTGKEHYKKIIQFFYAKGVQGDLESVMLLDDLLIIQKFVLAQKPVNFSDALHFAVAANNSLATDWLLGQETSIKAKTLNLACAKNYLAIVKLLVTQGASVNPLEKYAENPLYVAAENGHTDVVAFLLESKANVSANYAGRTALHIAARRGYTAIVKLLLAKGANPIALDESGSLPLHEAARTGHKEVACLLLQAILSIQNENHETPLSLAQAQKYESLLNLFKALEPEVSASSTIQTTSPILPKTNRQWLTGSRSRISLNKKAFFLATSNQRNSADGTATTSSAAYRPYEKVSQAVKPEEDHHWYTDDEMNNLFEYYLGNESSIELLTAMLGTQWNEGNTLGDNLKQFYAERLQNIANNSDHLNVKNKILIPVNLHNSHWTLLYIIFDQTSAKLPTVYYFDPLGETIPTELKNIFANNELFPNTQIVDIGKRVQQDGYNCGPWIIEAARAIAKNGSLPEESFNIKNARQEHADALSKAKCLNLN